MMGAWQYKHEIDPDGQADMMIIGQSESNRSEARNKRNGRKHRGNKSSKSTGMRLPGNGNRTNDKTTS